MYNNTYDFINYFEKSILPKLIYILFNSNETNTRTYMGKKKSRLVHLRNTYGNLFNQISQFIETKVIYYYMILELVLEQTNGVEDKVQKQTHAYMNI